MLRQAVVVPGGVAQGREAEHVVVVVERPNGAVRVDDGGRWVPGVGPGHRPAPGKT